MKRDLTRLQRDRLERMEAGEGLTLRDHSTGRWVIAGERVSSEPMMQLLRRGLITEGVARGQYRDWPGSSTYFITPDGLAALADVRGAW